MQFPPYHCFHYFRRFISHLIRSHAIKLKFHFPIHFLLILPEFFEFGHSADSTNSGQFHAKLEIPEISGIWRPSAAKNSRKISGKFPQNFDSLQCKHTVRSRKRRKTPQMHWDVEFPLRGNSHSLDRISLSGKFGGFGRLRRPNDSAERPNRPSNPKGCWGSRARTRARRTHSRRECVLKFYFPRRGK